MKYECDLYLAIPIIAASSLIACADKPGEAHSSGGQGFTEAFFDLHTVEDMLGKEKCEVLRFYNVRRASDDTDGTVLMIAATGDHGKDLYEYWQRSTWYRRYDKLDGDRALITRRAKAGAEEGIGWVKAAGDSSYATNFSAPDVRELLRIDGCNGIRLVPERHGEDWSMRMTAVTIEEGRATELDPPEGDWICTQPCPSFCGTGAYYIHRR